eukprot:c46865_g1_i1 orf=1-213(-)
MFINSYMFYHPVGTKFSLWDPKNIFKLFQKGTGESACSFWRVAPGVKKRWVLNSYKELMHLGLAGPGMAWD